MTTLILYALAGICTGLAMAIALPIVSEALRKRRIDRLTAKRPKARVVTLTERIACVQPEKGEAA